MHSLFDQEQLELFRKEHQLQPYRIKQIMQEIFVNNNTDFDDMTTLSKDLRVALKEKFSIIPLGVDKIIEDDETSKFLFTTADNNVVEAVLMYHFHIDEISGHKKLNRMTLCISSQV